MVDSGKVVGTTASPGTGAGQLGTVPPRLLLIEPAGSDYLGPIEAAAHAAGLVAVHCESIEAAVVARHSIKTTAVAGVGPRVDDMRATGIALLESLPELPLLLFCPPEAHKERACQDVLSRGEAMGAHVETLSLSDLDEPRALVDALRPVGERVLRHQHHLRAVRRISRQLAHAFAETTAQNQGDAAGSQGRESTTAAGSAAMDHYLASVLAQASEAIVSTDARGCVRTWNAAAERLFAFPAERALGYTLDFLDAHTVQRLETGTAEERLVDVVERVLRSGVPEQVDLVYRHPAHREVLHASASIAPVRGEERHLLGLSVIARDISERHRAEEALREASQQKDAFLAVMSHELRTPLTSILGYTDMLLRGMAGPSTPRAHGYLENVRSAGHRLLSLVNGLLEYSRLEAGAERLMLQPVDLTHAVLRAVDRVRPQAEAKRLRIELKVPGERLPPVVADDDKVQQILSAYLVNAVKFTPDGGRVQVQVAPDYETPVEMVRVGVRDNGIGLAAEQCEFVWERFYQVDSSLTREQSGVGLGLAIVRHLAALHGGRVGVESAGLGRGSTFWVSLPVAR